MSDELDRRYALTTDAQLRRFLLDYEIRGARWTQYVSFAPLRKLVAHYFVRRVNRKLRNMKASLEMRERVRHYSQRHAGGLDIIDGGGEASHG